MRRKKLLNICLQNKYMKSLKDTCIEFFKNEDIRRDVKEMLKPMFSLVYNEIYLYVWIIAIYNVFFFVGFLILFWIVLKINYRTSLFNNSL